MHNSSMPLSASTNRFFTDLSSNILIHIHINVCIMYLKYLNLILYIDILSKKF